MKKFGILGICLATGMSVFAQADLVKEVERSLKASSPNYEEAVKKIQPALTNDDTKDLVTPWYLAGKASFGLFDQLYLKETLGEKLNDDQKKTAGNAMVDGYGYFFKALPLDQKPDEKGKIKPKHTKEMLKQLKNNYVMLRNAGVFLFEAQDFKGAYDAWELYVTLPEIATLGTDAPKADPDTVVGNIMYYQMLAALSNDMNEEALAKFRQVEKSGYKNIDAYVYGTEAARRLNDSVAMLEIAHKGYDMFGTQNIQFIGQIINDRLFHEDYAACEKLTNEALQATTDPAIQSQLYDILGVVYENSDRLDDAFAALDKAIELNPENAKNYYDKARLMFNQAIKIDEEVQSLEERKQKVIPLLVNSAELFEKAYGMDEVNNSNVPGILYRLYYRLGAGYEDKANYWKDL